jgi:hypothetical protein
MGMAAHLVTAVLVGSEPAPSTLQVGRSAAPTSRTGALANRG